MCSVQVLFLILLKRVQVTRVYRLCRELKLLSYLSVVMASPRPVEETEEGAMGRPSFKQVKIYLIYLDACSALCYVSIDERVKYTFSQVKEGRGDPEAEQVST